MSDDNSILDPSFLREWHTNVDIANRNNIFCHCRTCDAQWIDSAFEVSCPNCDSKNVETVSCWQFPDD